MYQTVAEEFLHLPVTSLCSISLLKSPKEDLQNSQISKFYCSAMAFRKLLLRGKIKKVLFRANMCSLEQRARNAHDQNKQTLLYLPSYFIVIKLIHWGAAELHVMY